MPHQDDISQNRIIAAVGYLGVLFLVPLLAKKDSPYAQFHAKQGMVLCLLWIAAWLFGWFPFLGWAIWVGALILTVIGVKNAYEGKTEELPIIGKYAGKIKI